MCQEKCARPQRCGRIEKFLVPGGTEEPADRLLEFQCGKCLAIQGDEGSCAPITFVMDRSGEVLFAHPFFAPNQDSRLGAPGDCQLPCHAQHAFALTDERLRSKTPRERDAERGEFRVELVSGSGLWRPRCRIGGCCYSQNPGKSSLLVE